MDETLRDRLKPNQNGLLNLLSNTVTNDMLLEIAKADYGYDVELNFKELITIRDERKIPSPMEWCPSEVLALTRWSEPNDADWKPGATGKHGHIIRAFCCIALLLAAADPENEGQMFTESNNETLALLLASLSALGETYEKSALGFIVWRLDTLDLENEERPFFILAILYLALKLRTDLSDEEIGTIAETLFQEEERVRSADWASLPYEHEYWLLGLTFFSQKHYLWQALGDELVKLAQTIHDQQVQERVVDIGHRLAQKIVPRITGFE